MATIVKQDTLKQLEIPEGCVIEVGSYKGRSAKEMFELWPNRKYYLFDSFEGVAEQGPHDKEFGSTMFDDSSEEILRDNLGLLGGIKYELIKGRVEETFPKFHLQEPLAVVHLDCDLYIPHVLALEKFWPLLKEGGIVFFHDYWLPGVRKAIQDYFGTLDIVQQKYYIQKSPGQKPGLNFLKQNFS